MNSSVMAGELNPLLKRSGARAPKPGMSSHAVPVGLLAIAGVAAYASGAVPAPSLGLARLGELAEFFDTVANVEGANATSPDPAPAAGGLDAEGFTDVVYPETPLGYLRSIVDLSPCFEVCAFKTNPEALITAAFSNNDATCDDIAAALSGSACYAETCADDCVQKAFNERARADACGGGVDVDTLKSAEYAFGVARDVRALCPAYPPTDPMDGVVNGTVGELGAFSIDDVTFAPGHRETRERVLAEKRRRAETAKVGARPRVGPDFKVWNGYADSMQTIPTVPEGTVAKGSSASQTFTLLTQCKMDEVKYLNPEFWFSPLVTAKIVKHNYGNPDMFSYENAIEMERKEISDGVYGYQVTTDKVDWEYGYALENKRGEVWYEIGANPAPLYGENCTQMYGSFYNRIATMDSDKQFLFGSCLHDCPAGWRDAAYCRKPLTEALSSTTRLDLGKCDDARLVVFGSAVLFGATSVIDPSGRSECLRDTTHRDDDSEARWTCGTVDYDLSKLKMVGVRVVRAADKHCYATQSYAKKHSFSSAGASTYNYTFEDATHISNGRCRNAACAASKYPLGPIAAGSSNAPGLGATRLEYVTLSFGDAPPENKYIDMNDVFLTNAAAGRVVHRYGANEDLDARRIIPKNAALCGGAIYHANCFMTGKAYADTAFTPTKNEKRWIFVIVEHIYFKMIRMSVTVDGRDVKMRVIDAGYISHVRDASDIDTSDSAAYDVSDRYARRNFMPVAQCFAHLCTGGLSPNGYGIGSIKFDIAAEMSPSLKGLTC